MYKRLILLVFSNMLLFFPLATLAQSYSLTYEAAGLDTWNTSYPVADGNPRVQVTLPFSFLFFGTNYSSIWVNANPFAAIAVDIGILPVVSETNFRNYNMITPLWGAEAQSYKNEYSDRIVFTWEGDYSGSPFTVQAVLYNNGDVRLRYSVTQAVVENNASYVTGISKGDGTNYYHNEWTSNQTAYYKYVPAVAVAPTVAAAKLAPQIINFTASQNVTKRSQTMDFLFTVSDDVSVDPNAISASLVPKEGSRILIGRPTLRTGDEKTGVCNWTWRGRNNSRSGTDDVTLFVCDKAGNCNVGAVAGNLTINASLYFNFNEALKDSYNQTEIIKLSGEVVDFKNQKVKANVILDLSYSGGKFTFKNATEFGRYVLNYRTSLLDALGNWTIDLKATDTDGNEGTLTKKITLRQPQGFFYYNLVYLSPINDSTYYRGENLRASVRVLDLDKIVGDANVSLKLPTGELIPMSEVSPGTGIYQTSYKIKFSDKIGDWMIGVEGLKLTDAGLFAGSKIINVNVRPVDLKIDIISPTKNRFAVGDSFNIKVRVAYPDNSVAEGMPVNATPAKKSLALVETQSGIYEASYKFTQSDKGRYSLRIFAIDSSDNLGFVEKTISIVQPNLLDLFMQVWYITIPGLGLIGYTILHAKMPQILIRYYRNRLKTLEGLKKSTQDKYFVEDSIDENTYKKLIQDADREIVEIKAKVKEQETHLSKKAVKKSTFNIRDLISSTPKRKEKPEPKGVQHKDKYEREYEELKRNPESKKAKAKPKRETKGRAAILASLLKAKKISNK